VNPAAAAPAGRDRAFADPRTLMAIRNLELRARVVVEGFWNGLHRSPYHGFSVEFTEYRQYTSGDDTRYLDWRLFARSDRYYLKKFEDETNLRCYLLVDQSRSMDYGSIAYPKSDYARTLAATLAWFLHGQGDAVGLFTFADQVRDYLPARHRHGHLRQLMLALEQPGAGSATNLTAPLQRVAELVRRRGLLVLISDLLAPVDDMEVSLGRLAAAGHEIIVFQVLDPSEVNFDFRRATVFHDVESERDVYVDPDALRPEYRRRFEEHTQRIESLCRRFGVAFHRLITQDALEIALLNLLRSRERRGKSVRRQGQRMAVA
jgi:uncharacterized protein (DUF58 family)